MNISEYMKKHNLTDVDPRHDGSPMRMGTMKAGGGEVFTGSHLDGVGKRRVAVIYDARDAQRVAAIARSRGVKPSEVYRDALEYYLAAQAWRFDTLQVYVAEQAECGDFG